MDGPIVGSYVNGRIRIPALAVCGLVVHRKVDNPSWLTRLRPHTASKHEGFDFCVC